jgi:hypothetical protein
MEVACCASQHQLCWWRPHAPLRRNTCHALPPAPRTPPQTKTIDASEFANLKAITKEAKEEGDNPLEVRARARVRS